MDPLVSYLLVSAQALAQAQVHKEAQEHGAPERFLDG